MSAWLALVVSIAALVAAGLSAKYARDQARASTAQLRIIEDQAHELRAPRIAALQVEAETTQLSASITTVRFTNVGSVDLEQVEVECADVAVRQAMPASEHAIFPLRAGEEQDLVLGLRVRATQVVIFRLSCRSSIDPRSWIVPVACTLVPDWRSLTNGFYGAAIFDGMEIGSPKDDHPG